VLIIMLGERGKLKGKPQPDASLRDTENVPLTEDVETYFAREVFPHVPDAWIDHEKEKGFLSEIISRVNDLFEGDLTDDDRLIYVNNVLKGKLLESETLVEQAANNTKEQFASSPDLSKELLNAIMDALEAHTSMSTLNSERVREGLKDVLLGPAQLYEALRERSNSQPSAG